MASLPISGARWESSSISGAKQRQIQLPQCHEAGRGHLPSDVSFWLLLILLNVNCKSLSASAGWGTTQSHPLFCSGGFSLPIKMQIKLGKRQISRCTSPNIRMFVIRVAKLPEYELHTKISIWGQEPHPPSLCTPLLPHTCHAPVNPHVSLIPMILCC